MPLTEFTDQFHRLVGLVADLRDPEKGCAWDLAQTASSIAPDTIEEAYEVAAAIASGQPEQVCDELGDLMLQVVLQARIAEEAGHFDVQDVARAIVTKLIRRHPHVFDDSGRFLETSARIEDPGTVAALWEAIKHEERSRKSAEGQVDRSPLGPLPHGFPALIASERISRSAASAGFDWANFKDVTAKVREEIDEVEDAADNKNSDAVEEEIGDLLFSVANLARHLDVNPEQALRRANAKFHRRFTAMAAVLERSGQSLETADLETMEVAWRRVKEAEAILE